VHSVNLPTGCCAREGSFLPGRNIMEACPLRGPAAEGSVETCGQHGGGVRTPSPSENPLFIMVWITCKENRVVKKSKNGHSLDTRTNNLIRGTIAGIAGLVLFTALAGLLPTFSLMAFCLSFVNGLMFLYASIWLNLNFANLHARFFYFLTLTIFFVIIAYRGFAALSPKYELYVGLVVIATVAISNSLPIWNPKITNGLRSELVAPKSKMGKTIFLISILAGPIVGVFIYFFIDFTGVQNKYAAGSLFLSTLSWIMALILPFSSATPSSPWEKSEIK